MSTTQPEPGHAAHPDAIRKFLLDQIGRLDRFEFVTVGSPRTPFTVLEVVRTEAGTLEVRVPPRLPQTPLDVPKRAKLLEAGFSSADPAQPFEPWVVVAADPDAAIDMAVSTLRTVFDVDIGEAINVLHGSHRAAHEAAQQLQEMRQRLQGMLTEFIGHVPEQDGDGDFIYRTEHVRVIVAPRVVPDAFAVVRIIAITNLGVAVSPELGLFLARLNFGLVFGRFALDAQHQSIWFDESLLGENLTSEQLRFTITMVANTAGEWAGRLQQLFGGHVHGDILADDRDAAQKPGTGGYL